MGATEQAGRLANDSRWIALDPYFEETDDTAATFAEKTVSREPVTVAEMTLRKGGVQADLSALCPIEVGYGEMHHMGE